VTEVVASPTRKTFTFPPDIRPAGVLITAPSSTGRLELGKSALSAQQYRPRVGDDEIVTAHVLLADDDRAIRESLVRALELDGFRVTAVPDGVRALAEVRRWKPDLVVLDVMMPGVDGLGVCQVMRADGMQVPILMLTARVEVPDRVAGLDAGADDYLAKPFELEELMARIRALLRRAQPGSLTGESEVVQAQGVRVDPASRRAFVGVDELVLSKTEFDLLELLVRNAGLVLSHTAIYERIWGYDFGPDSKNLAVYISYLRRKLDALGDPQVIRTVRGVGYSVSVS